jgi:hypothetical protein
MELETYQVHSCIIYIKTATPPLFPVKQLPPNHKPHVRNYLHHVHCLHCLLCLQDIFCPSSTEPNAGWGPLLLPLKLSSPLLPLSLKELAFSPLMFFSMPTNSVLTSPLLSMYNKSLDILKTRVSSFPLTPHQQITICLYRVLQSFVTSVISSYFLL